MERILKDDQENKRAKFEAEELKNRIRLVAKKEIKKFVAAFKMLLNKKSGGI